jgi:hypothetical protein
MRYIYNYLTGKNQGMHLPNWFLILCPKYIGNYTWKWLFFKFYLPNSRAGDTLSMAMKRKEIK